VARLEHRLRRVGIDFIHVDASGSVVDPLVRFFRMRERRSRR
jgi:glutaredoxin-related protein